MLRCVTRHSPDRLPIFQYIYIFKKLPYAVCFQCSAGAVIVSVALSPLMQRSLSADIQSFHNAATLTLFASTPFKKTYEHYRITATLRAGMHTQ